MSEKQVLDLSGQAAFVTGAGQGAGRGIAHMLGKSARAPLPAYAGPRH